MICDGRCQPPCSYGCELRAKGIRLSSAACPTRQNRVAPHRPDPAWERGRAGEWRGDSFVPYLNADLSEMGVKQFADHRGQYEARLDRLRKDPTVFAAETAAAPKG